MKTFLITGGAGFIGSSLVDKLIDDNKIIVIDNFNDYYSPDIKKNNIKEYENNTNFKLYIGDILDKDLLSRIFSENNIDCVIHLAAMAGVRNSLENPYIYQEVNCMGTLNILEEMKKNNISKIIFSSSSSVYANNKEVPFTEDMTTSNSISPYAATKKSCEVMLHVYHKLYNIDSIIFRFFTVYGPRQRPDLAISKFTKLIMEDKEITMYGDGTTYRDYTYIDDIINGIILAINYLDNNSNIYEIINLGSSNPVKLIDMINIIGNKLNKNVSIKRLDMQAGDVDRTYASITKANKLLGYSPSIKFSDGIEKYIEWYKKV